MSAGIDLKQPLFFQPNRVWRCYTGGVLLGRFVGNAPGKDGDFPEDWLASTTVALNGPHQQGPEEGLSRIRLPGGTDGPLLKDLIEADPEACLGPGADPEAGVGVLCKFLDSAIRLPIQCHPDRAFARTHYKSEHGKAESWFVLGGRAIDGEEPYILMGFKPDVRREDLREAVAAQDIAAMVAMLHRVPAAAGDAYFIPGRFPHAIGSGVFLLEVQEPTDWVVQPERFVGHTELSESDMWGPLSPEVGLDCFDYDGAGTVDDVLDRVRLRGKMLLEGPGGIVERLVGPDVTDCFRVDRLTVEGEMDYTPGAPYHIAVVTGGAGQIQTDGHAMPVKRGDTLFLPHAVRSIRYKAGEERLQLFVITRG